VGVIGVAAAILAAFLGLAILLLVKQFWDQKQLIQQQGRLEAELQQMAALAGTVSVGDWLRSVQDLTTALVQSGVCEAAVLLQVAENGALEPRASAWSTAEPDWNPAAEEGIKQVVEHGETVALAAGGLLLPVVEEQEVAGVLALRGARVHSQAVAMAVKLAALGLTGMRLYQKQAVLSNTDGLTGLANHRHFQQTLSVALAQAYLENEPLALVLLDIDHFKTVNDTYGHLFGDLVLREIAYLLRRELPPDTLPARYGGEEFAIVLRGDMGRNAADIAERVRQTIAGHQVFDFTSGARLSVTVSLGVAQYELGQGKSKLIARADEALYTSKHEGRNCVTVAAPENSTSHLFPS
jgi:diguanylate cyclase (GGDEF)-like protein